MEVAARPDPRFYHEHVSPVREFLAALGARYTFSLRRNPYALFGFLWGLPIPLFSIGLGAGSSGSWPAQAAFALHPFLFAVLFGAWGTIRRAKDRRIAQLVGELRRHVEELRGAHAKLQELDRLKAQFLANVTHELKTPLVAIGGWAEILKRGRQDPSPVSPAETAEVILRNVERLRKTIDELLDFERLESGEAALAPEDFDLVPVVRSVVESFEPEVRRKSLRLEENLPARLPVRADPEKIRRVLSNLVSNAVKFSPEGKAVGVAAKPAEYGRVVVTVWDEGPGIPTAAQKFLFSRFWRGESPAARRTSGTGLGLAIVKAILDAHGSWVDVVSDAGSGTVVHFDLAAAPE